MGPVSEEKKRIKLTLNPLIYKTFVALCRSRKLGHPSHLVEQFMRACIRNPTLITLIRKLSEE
ncbi:MAG: hypothetical protein QXH03_10685 [Candidatus Bathyarchaeia archaeon]|nr:hypothetical protein [Candidatus Bathyarchaeota archaeon]